MALSRASRRMMSAAASVRCPIASVILRHASPTSGEWNRSSRSLGMVWMPMPRRMRARFKLVPGSWMLWALPTSTTALPSGPRASSASLPRALRASRNGPARHRPHRRRAAPPPLKRREGRRRTFQFAQHLIPPHAEMQRRTDQPDARRLQLERLVHQIGDELDVAAMVGIGMRLGGGERFPQGRDKHGPGLAFQHGLLHPRSMSVRHLGREAGGAGHPRNAPPDDLRVGGRRKQERKAQFREKGLKEREIFMKGQHTGIADDAPRARLALRLIGGP